MATVIPIRRAVAAVEEAFAKYENAKLVNAHFGIDGAEPLFWGYHRADDRWNGWATPGFIYSVTVLIAEWLNQETPDTAWWDRDVLCVRNTESHYVDRLEPDQLGLYHFDGWCWLAAVTPPSDDA